MKKHYFRFQKDKIHVFMATQNYFDDFDNFHILLSFQKLFRLPPPLTTQPLSMWYVSLCHFSCGYAFRHDF